MEKLRTIGQRSYPGGGGGGGGSEIFYTYVGSGYFFGFKLLNFNIEYFLGYEDFVDIFIGSPQNWPTFRGHLYGFYGLFLRARYRMGDNFWVAKISYIFFGCL